MVKQWRQSWLLSVAGEQLSEQWWLKSGTQHWDSAKVFFFRRGHGIVLEAVETILVVCGC